VRAEIAFAEEEDEFEEDFLITEITEEEEDEPILFVLHVCATDYLPR